jgi:hypothetical protein
VTNYVLVHAPPLCQRRVAVIPGLADAQLWRPHGMPCLIPRTVPTMPSLRHCHVNWNV